MRDDGAPDPDQEWVEQFQAARIGARGAAFRVLYERHAGPLHAYLARLAASDHTADDLTQEAFLKAYEGLDRFELRSSFKTWLYHIATHLYRDGLRRRRPVTNADGVAQGMADPAPTPADAAADGEELRRVRDAVRRLPDALRVPLLLVRLEGMSYRQASEVLGITLEALRMRVHRAHMTLVQQLTR